MAFSIHTNTTQDHTLSTTLDPTRYPPPFPFDLQIYEHPQFPLDRAKLVAHIIRDIVNIWGYADNPIIRGNIRWADPIFHMDTYIIQAQQAPHQAAQHLDLRSIAYAFERIAWVYLTRVGFQWSCALRVHVSRSDAPAPGNGVLDIVIGPVSEPLDSTAVVNDTANATMIVSGLPVHMVAETEVTVDTVFSGTDIAWRMTCLLFYEAIRRLCKKDRDSACPRSDDIGIARIVSPDGQAQMQVTVLQAGPPRRVLTMYQLGRALFYLLSTYADSGRWEGSMSTIRLDGGLVGTVTIEKLPSGLDIAQARGGDNETATA